MNINLQGSSLFSSGQFMLLNQGLKSTEEKLKRQAQCNRQVAFFEQQKDSLKKISCDTLDDIAQKLEMFHDYENAIVAAKAAYNNEQMLHILDEAKEMGEKIAKRLEKLAPKTEEERKKETIEEALGIEEQKSLLEELAEDAQVMLEEMQEQLTEELEEEVVFDNLEKIQLVDEGIYKSI